MLINILITTTTEFQITLDVDPAKIQEAIDLTKIAALIEPGTVIKQQSEVEIVEETNGQTRFAFGVR